MEMLFWCVFDDFQMRSDWNFAKNLTTHSWQLRTMILLCRHSINIAPFKRAVQMGKLKIYTEGSPKIAFHVSFLAVKVVTTEHTLWTPWKFWLECIHMQYITCLPNVIQTDTKGRVWCGWTDRCSYEHVDNPHWMALTFLSKYPTGGVFSK